MSSTVAIALAPHAPRRRPVIVRVLTNPLGAVSLVVLVAVTMIAALAGVLAPYGPNFAEVGNTLAQPGADHLLGTDSAGRDVYSRLLWGAQLTLLSALLCAAVAIAIGLPAGLLAGYYGRWFDTASNWTANLLLSLPAIIVLLSVRTALGPSVWLAMVVFGILISPGYYRLTRTAVQSVRNELYVDAARVSGLSDARIIGRHVMSVVRAPIIIQTALVAGVAIAIQSGVEFLGLGNPQEVTWGAMLSEGFRNIYIAPGLIVWPAVAIGVTVGAFVLLGNALRDALEDAPQVKVSRKAVEAALQTGIVTDAVAGTNLVLPVEETREEPTAVPTPSSAPSSAPEVPSGSHLLEVRDLAIGYPTPAGSIKRVVEGVTLHVDRGEVLSIVGESGSGKSQTAFAILGLLPDAARIVAGSIVIDGVQTVASGSGTVSQQRIAALRGRRVSYIPQEPMSNLDPAYTIGHQLSRPMVKLLGIGKSEAKKRVLDLLERVGIADPTRTFDLYPHEISGGMAQRVLIAGAVSCGPDLIIADEPTTALDVTVQAEVLELLREMRDKLGVAIVLVTHNFGVVSDLADRVAVMRNGRLIETGAVRDVLRAPREEYTRTLLDSMLEGKQPLQMLTKEARG
ncbi:dipeptide/oligopeptide/nickel ABC transporter permease/ATP-binding protein [Microbacterium sp. Clip185]|uniref:dipeptide/oligopeptide/nickel ABC transporter permease/ATP-binding protein n=1 Tax=Microbacterium sp. Clip185 TaxID=3025663 RepID=UPI002365359B|nr:dipeptide/oligopeptide/nickel ABC transporter permease/ATP-binding protein [Microbacterium sp. Clip185]WDG18645.1 dipeptide/oligopeptide/nickel ABC transporter permease/ATP-binding protein [Microbacterium sp. Clip185]